LWPLAATLDIGTCVVFGYDLTDPKNPVSIADRLHELKPARAEVGERPWALVCCELVCNTGRADYEPAGMVEVARFYPVTEVLSNIDRPTVRGAVKLVRPKKTGMNDHEWGNGGEHELGLFADRNADLGLAEAAAEWVAGKPGNVLPFWDNLFEYAEPDAIKTGAVYLVVDPARATARSFPKSPDRMAYNRITRSYGATDVLKVERQGDFDNVHIAPPMAVGPISIGVGKAAFTLPRTKVTMAPLCSHDCFHMHWRWSRQFREEGTNGFNAAGHPNSEPGAAMVPLNQKVELAVQADVPGFDYRVTATGQSTNSWAIIMHHGAGYALEAKIQPTVLVDAMLTRMAIPAPARTWILGKISVADDVAFAWLYFFMQRWPHLMGTPPSDLVLKANVPVLMRR
jgi:hypothetical protein